MFIFLANIPSAISIIAACILAHRGVDGWGWFLVVAIVLGNTFSGAINGRKKVE